MDKPSLIGMNFFEIARTTFPLFLQGAYYTILLTATAVVLGGMIGLIIALMKMGRFAPTKLLGTFYTWVFRGTPLLVQIWLWYFGLPQLTGINLPGFVAGSLALSINAGAYLAEIYRAAIESIPRGQMEAARSLGMSYGAAMRRVILPQAYRRMLPPMINEFIALLKDSSLVATIGVYETLFTAKTMTASSFRPFELYTLASIYYLIMTTGFTYVGSKLERWLLEHE